MNRQKNAKTFGDWAYIAIELNYHKILEHEKEVLKDKDPEELHQMRVRMRRLRSAIGGFSPALNLPKTAREKKVGKIAKILGTLRDLDVLGETLENQYKPILLPVEQKEIDRALKYFKKQRYLAFKQVQIALNGDTYQDLKKGFENWLKDPQYQLIADINIQAILPDLLLPQIGKLLLHPAWLIGTNLEAGEVTIRDGLESQEVEKLLETQGLSLHDLRKEAKRTRYLMELFTQFYNTEYKTYLSDIKIIQSVLGEIQDSFVLGNFITEVFSKDFHKTMPGLASQLTKCRYDKWQQWQQLQQKFLTPQTRQDLHKTIFHPL